jgi:hypothetical protein
VCPAGYRHQRANGTEKHPSSGTIARPFVEFFQNQLHFLRTLIMRQTEVTAPAFSLASAPTFTVAAIRFVVSLAALISVSVLLAGL